MNTTLTTSATWVHCRLGKRKPYWLDISRLKQDLSLDDYSQLLWAFKAARRVVIEQIDMELTRRPMPIRVSRRLTYLINHYAQSGFQLAYFRDDSAVFYRVGQKAAYYSMNEMLEQGYLPKASIAVSPFNVPVQEKGKLVDVFVPVERALENFTK